MGILETESTQRQSCRGQEAGYNSQEINYAVFESRFFCRYEIVNY